jgi:hypothetical protein
MVSEVFASVLAARRADYNAQFLAARRASSELDEEAFKAFLGGSVDPLVGAVAAVDDRAVPEVVDVAFSVGLELVAQRLVGPRASAPALDHGFQVLFPSLARFVAEAPAWVLPKLCNALHALSTTPGARPLDWCATLTNLAPLFEDTRTLLGAGQVAAWLCGLSQYRAGALRLCQELPGALVAALLQVQPATVPAVLARLAQDPWFVPGSPELGFRVVGSVGSFRGFGGAFLGPPQALRVGPELVVVSGPDAWLLALDAFGCTFHRVRPDELGNPQKEMTAPGIVIEQARVSAFGKTLPVHDTGALTSVACNATTLLMTTAHSYGVTVVALESGR